MENLVRITRIPRETFYQNLLDQNERKEKTVLPSQLPLRFLSKYLSDRTVMPADAPVPECTTCGACCAFLLFVPVTLRDCASLREFVEITLDDPEHEIGIDRVLPRKAGNGHCVNLAGTLGVEIGCTIYADRPGVCHDFDAGSDRCHEYRRIYGFEPQLSETDLQRALARLEKVERKERIRDVRIILADTVVSYSYSVSDPDSDGSSESVRLKIFVFMDDGQPYELHYYDPSEETWLESDFLSLTIAEAEALIASKQEACR